MYLTPYQKKQIKYVLVLLFGIPATLFAVYKGVQIVSQASSDPTPKDVIVSNITTNSITISWVTEKSVEAYVIPVVSGSEQSPVGDKRGNGKRVTHYVELRNLSPDTQYTLILLSDGERYDRGSAGQFSARTAPIGTDTPVPNPIHGTVVGSNLEDIIVYAMFSSRGVYPVSVIVPSSGNWIVDLSSLRNTQDMSLVKTSNDTEMILLAREGVNKGYVLEGSYSSLFDSNGKLNQTYTFTIGELSEISSYFPSEVILGTAAATPVAPTPTPPVQEEEDDDDDYIPIPQPSITYTIKHDLDWIDMASGSSNLNLSGGEDTVLITNLTDVGFTVVWRSSEAQTGYVKLGTSKTDLSTELRDLRDGYTSMSEYSSHLIESGRLDPDTTYYFEIYTGDSLYDNDGEKYSVRTLSTLSSPPPFETKTGTVSNISDASDLAILFKIVDSDELGTLGSSGYMSVLPDQGGSWVVTVGDARSEDGSSYFSYSSSDILQAYFLGAESSKFDFNLSQENMVLDVSEIGSGVNTSGVQLLADYGIIIFD